MKKKRLIFLILLVLLGAGFIYGYMQYNKPHRDVQKTKAAFELKAEDLFSQFSENEKQASTKFAGQVLIVSGKVVSKKVTDSTANILLDAGDDLYGVSCDFLKDEIATTESVDKNSIVKIKGECQGFIDDVIISKCAIIK